VVDGGLLVVRSYIRVMTTLTEASHDNGDQPHVQER
jgi:hypothetical protein